MKYKLNKNTISHWSGKTLFQIEATASFGSISKGDLGGYIEKESNLSQDGDAWVHGDAQVFGDARVHGDAQVFGDARVHGNAWVYDDALVSGRISLTVNCDAEMPRMLINTKDKLTKLLEAMNELKE